ncbi:DedA family protein [Corynebacterium tapiri]|uniref:DedA family protein n=1 Tax=Corynebacterium tapiri TaxID=1448266 RepID=UPI0015D6063F|nr:hypothetical protein [Corynebacterium tapiri]
MDELVNGYPFWAAWGLLFVVGFLRGQATYGLARLAVGSAVGRKSQGPKWWQRTAEWLQAEGNSRGRQILHRVGPLAVSLCYLTVGLQTAILVAAGLTMMRYSVFTIAQLPGVAAWATIYSTIGFAAWAALISAMAGQWWPLLAIIFVVLVAALTIRWWRRTRGPAKEELTL